MFIKKLNFQKHEPLTACHKPNPLNVTLHPYAATHKQGVYKNQNWRAVFTATYVFCCSVLFSSSICQIVDTGKNMSMHGQVCAWLCAHSYAKCVLYFVPVFFSLLFLNLCVGDEVCNMVFVKGCLGVWACEIVFGNSFTAFARISSVSIWKINLQIQFTGWYL